MTQIVFGKNVVFQTLESNRKVFEVYVADASSFIIQKLKAKNIQYQVISKKMMDKMTNQGIHQGIAAKVEAYRTYSVDAIIAKNGLIVLLDGIEDPHNLGAILRSCDACGVDGVIIGKNRSVGLNATVAKVSTGAIDHVKVCEVTNLSQTIQYLKEKGYWVVGTDVKNARDYRQIQVDVPLVIVIGNEGKGISTLVAKNCDYMVHIPMKGHVESLNASVSCAVLLYNIINLREMM